MSASAFLAPVIPVPSAAAVAPSGRATVCRPPSLTAQSAFVVVPARRPTATINKAPARVLPVAIAAGAAPSASPVRSLPSVAALADLLRAGAPDAHPFVVVKLFARSCRACMGASPRYVKTARAFRDTVGPDAVTFAEMDYSENRDFCKNYLGVEALPFFAIFRRGDDDLPELVEGHVLPWNRMSILDERVEEILTQERTHSP